MNDYAIKPTAKKILRQLPNKGDFNLDSVLKSIYFFS